MRSGIVVAALAAFSCANEVPSAGDPNEVESVASSQEALSASFSLRTLTGDPRTTLLSTTTSLTVDARVDLGDGSKLETITSFGSGSAGTTVIDAATNIRGNLTSGGPVTIAAQSVVSGFLRSGGTITKQAPVTIAGGEFPNAAISSTPTSWIVNIPDTNGGDVLLPLNTARTLAPGAWARLDTQNGARLSLRSGTYYFDSVTIEPGSQLLLDKTQGPILIYVKTTFSFKGTLVTTAGVATDTLIGVLGTGTNAAYVEGPMVGTVVVPNGNLDLRRTPNDVPHRGAFFAKSIHVFSDIDIHHAPFSFDFLCSAGDTDKDGASDCSDGCPLDPAKKAPGIAGCGKVETDTDGDGVPNPIDGTPNDPTSITPGQCGSVDTGLTATGTPCTDRVCPADTNSQCNGSGVCGTPTACAPAATGCTLRRFDNSIYWVCAGAVSWTQAATNCRAISGRHLARINSRVENDFVAAIVGGKAWHGGNDSTTEGAWRWSTAASNNGDQFWAGDATGTASANRYQRWSAGQPAAANDCGAIQGPGAGAGEWTAEVCTASLRYVCEQPIAFAPVPPPPLDCGGSLFPERGCSTPPAQSSSCVPQSTALPQSQADAEAQINACNAAFANGTCTAAGQAGCSACAGIASVPNAGSCPAYEPDEIAHCGLTNVVTTGCTAGVDCCSFVEATLLTQTFETNTGTFAYVDDAFRASAQPSYASGVRVTAGGNPGAAAQVTLGGINTTPVANMSGGWRSSFSVATASAVILSFDYNLSQSPNYEATEQSQILVTVDGVLKGLNFTDLVDRVAGDGDGGASITSGWRSFRLNLGDLAVGSHTLTIGAFNSGKDNTNETTTLLIDNVKVIGRDDSCAAGQICGPVYAAGCNPCDTVDAAGKCVRNCAASVLRCGTPGPKCANATISGSRCESVEVCASPEATGPSDPRTAGDLSATTFNPVSEFGAATTPASRYYPDPACASPPCALGQQNRWCKYTPNIWEDPAVTNGNPDLVNPLPPKATLPDAKRGESGSAAVKFVFDPNIHLDYKVTPLGVGQVEFALDALAALRSSVAFNIGSPPLGVNATADIIDAQLKLHLERCRFSTAESRINIFGQDFVPDSIKPSLASKTISGCAATIASYTQALNRVKKAYRDAVELVRQYQARKTAAERFPADFCQRLTADLPNLFPAGNCGVETAAATVNRFIDYYEAEIKRVLVPANLALSGKNFANSGALINVATSARDSETLVEVLFPLGPIPMKLEIEAFVEYGLRGNVSYSLNPSVLFVGSDTRETLASIDGHVYPYALSGISMFVGAGIGWGPFSVSAGVRGAITLGRLSLDNFAGAGIGVQATKDNRTFPADILAVADAGAAEGKLTLFPPNGAKKYDFTLQYNYGSKIVLSEILKGSIAARVRIKIAFFSKEWRRTLFTFPGFGPIDVPLISGGGDGPAVSVDGHNWGSFQVPLPFIQIPRLNAQEVLSGTSRAFQTTNVEEVFFDNLCQCSLDSATCSRNADCCNHPTSVCFADPATGSAKVCAGCRSTAASCNVIGDCCPAETPRFCEDDPATTQTHRVCRQCRGVGEACATNADCCASNRMQCSVSKTCQVVPT